MRLLYVANIRLPTEKAHGIQIMKMCSAFAEYGHTVELILPTRVNPLSKEDPFAYYGVLPQFSIRQIATLDPWWLFSFPSGMYIKVQALLFMLSLFLSSTFRSHARGALIYTRDEYLLSFLQRFSRDVVWECHGMPLHPARYRALWERCRHIIAITASLKAELSAQGIPANRISVSPDGVDLAEFAIVPASREVREELSVSPQAQMILYTGHLYPWKGVDTLARAARLLPSSCSIVIIGGTDADAARLRKEYAEASNLFILGHKARRDVPRYLKAASAVVLPNSAKEKKSARYTSPLKLFEYMASGRPIIASDLPSIREILDENCAVLVPPDDPHALADAIKRVLADQSLGKRLAENARARVAPYTWKARAWTILLAIDASHE